MKKTTLFISLIIILVLGGWWHTAHSPSVNTDDSFSVTPATYTCKDNKVIKAMFYNKNGEPAATEVGKPPVPTNYVQLTFVDNTTKKLMQTISADGGRYANTDESFIFWVKGTGAMVLENNKEVTYLNCVTGEQSSTPDATSQTYTSSTYGFSIDLPSYTTPLAPEKNESYKIDDSYTYQPDPSKKIAGIKFTIPFNLSKGTNLSRDSYISVESIKNTNTCTASQFFSDVHPLTMIEDKGVTYSVASSSDAGAGNRYEETVYALAKNNICFAVRYFVHYGAIENYPSGGAVVAFNKQKLLQDFDTIRRTLILK